MFHGRSFARGLKAGLFLVAVALAAYFLWGKDKVQELLPDQNDGPPVAKIKQQKRGATANKVIDALGDPTSRERGGRCWRYKSKEGPTYLLCFREGTLKSNRQIPGGSS